jgi:V/A-type H+/Na+-transporting ATPase subunit I
MIVAMKKATVITQHKDAPAALSQLRRLGLLHIEHQKPAQSQDISLLQEDASLITSCLEVFNQAGCELSNAVAKTQIGDWKPKARHLIDLWKRYGYLEDFSNTLQQQINEWQKWGDFDLQKLQEFEHKGICVKFYQVPLRQLKDLPQGLAVEQVFIAGGLAHCVVISTDKIELPFKEITLPRLSLSGMLAKLAEDKKAMQVIKDEICLAVGYISELREIKNKLDKEIEFQQALAGMGESRAVSYLTGYLPQEYESKLLAEAKIKKWGILISDPQEEDNVPVLLRNPRWVSLINPLYKLMEVVPGYRELDVSPIFLLFIALFFGMIIGDAGYGAIYFTLTFLAYCKYKHKVKDHRAFFLFYLFSFCAIIWGILTGTVFGQQWYAASGFKALAPALNNTKFLMAFCFFLGATQLSLAHGWQALSKLPALTALADIGFICLLWVGFFLAKMLSSEISFRWWANGWLMQEWH